MAVISLGYKLGRIPRQARDLAIQEFRHYLRYATVATLRSLLSITRGRYGDNEISGYRDYRWIESLGLG